MGGVSLVGAIMDGKPALEVARRTYRATADGVGFMIWIGGFFMGLELMRERLRREFAYRFPRWWPAVAAIAVASGVGMAGLGFVSDIAGEALRGVWGWQWDAQKMLRGALRMAPIGALLGVGFACYEAYSMSRPAARTVTE